MADIKVLMAILLVIFLSSMDELNVQAITNDNISRNCKDVQKLQSLPSDVYKVYPYKDNPTHDVKVYCDMDTDGGGWTLFQRRDNITPHVKFNRTWMEYALGFGDLNGEFWLGLDHIHALTDQKYMTLRIDLEDFKGNTRYAQYDFIYVDDRSNYFKLQIYGYTGDAGDSLSVHDRMYFSATDLDMDKSGHESCSVRYKGGWWYNACHSANLNGYYYGGRHESYGEGVNWRYWLGHHQSLKKTEMKIRPLFD